jgi:hypothetical protein
MLHYYLSTLLWGWMAAFHPFYVSLTDIRYNSEDQRIEMAQKIFWDDFEVALAEKYKVGVDFLNPEEPEKLEKMIKAYLLEMNEIHINNQKVILVYLGYEIEEDTAWFYLEGNNIARPQVAKIKNSILIHQFDKQQNIVTFYLGESPKSLITFKDKEWGELRF